MPLIYNVTAVVMILDVDDQEGFYHLDACISEGRTQLQRRKSRRTVAVQSQYY